MLSSASLAPNSAAKKWRPNGIKGKRGRPWIATLASGYQQREVMREWSHLHLCLADELENYAVANPGLRRT
jgi:hypothetical protein